MIRIKLVESVLQLKNGRALLQDRCTLPQISLSSKFSVTSGNHKTRKVDDDDDDEYDKPIKFSTSKAATFPAAYTIAEARGVPWYQPLLVSLSLITFMLYFCVLREENDIDEEMVKNIPPEILEQIYGKPKTPK